MVDPKATTPETDEGLNLPDEQVVRFQREANEMLLLSVIDAHEAVDEACVALRRAEAAEEELRQRKKQLQFALQVGRMGTWSLDLATGQLQCSDTCQAHFGRAPGEPLTYEQMIASFTEEHRPAWRQAVTRTAEQGHDLDAELRVRWPDGSLHWVHLRARALGGEAGAALTLSGIVLLADERRQIEERLRLLDALGQATRAASHAGEVLRVATELLGIHLLASHCTYAEVEPDQDTFTIRHAWTSPGEASAFDAGFFDRLGPQAAIDLRAGLAVVVRGADRERDPAPQGTALPWPARTSLICCPLLRGGKLVALLTVHQTGPREWMAEDVVLVGEVLDRSWAHTERLRATAALQEQDRHKDEFLATLAHELRNPLTPLRTGLDLLALLPPGDPAVAETKSIMDRQLVHMVRLIDDLLDVARISRGKLELRCERLLLQTVVSQGVEGSRPMIDAGGHALTIQVPEEGLWMEGDATRLAQVVSNLLNNAAKYTPHGGRIELVATLERDMAVLRVSDNGSGVAPDMVAWIFTPFTQVRRTLSRAQGGLGIGLSLVRKIVEMHGGTIQVSSPGLGQGSTFLVRLPLALAPGALAVLPPPSPSPPARPPVLVPAPAPLAGRRILVVDDNEDGAELLSHLLARRGHQTRIAHDGEQALMIARDFIPEVIFVDIGLPGIDGYEVTRQLRRDPLLAAVGIVALTGWGSEDDRRKSREAGVDVHLTKPVDVRTVEDALARLLAAPRPPGPDRTNT